MAEHSHISWTDATWNPITGCDLASPGCIHCFAMRLAGGRLQHHASRAGLTMPSKNGPVWNGEVRFNEHWLDQPLTWKRPRRIFVCAHGDLFYERVRIEWIDQVFAVMALARWHEFQVLTKRDRALERYLNHKHTLRRIVGYAAQIKPDSSIDWPLPNVHIGVSVEDRARVSRIDRLRDVPAALRFVSFEPLLETLGPVDLRGIGWAIIGGESGPHARPMPYKAAADLIARCLDDNVAVWCKQTGVAWRDGGWPAGTAITGKGDNPAEWPLPFRLQQRPALAGLTV